MNNYKAVASFDRFIHWFEQVFDVSKNDVIPFIKSFLDRRFGSVLESPLFSIFLQSGGSYNFDANRLQISCLDPNVLIQTVQNIRRTELSTIMRFVSWIFTAEVTSKVERLIMYAEPPNNIGLAERTFPVPDDIATNTESLAGWILPPETIYLDLDSKEPKNSFKQSTQTEYTSHKKVMAYGDVGGIMELVQHIEEEMPKKIQKSSLTILCDAIKSQIEEACKKAPKALQLEHGIGVGADGTYLVMASADSLLRLIICIQSNLANHGVAFIPWVLDTGVPEFTKDGQPSGKDFLSLYSLLKDQINGDVLTTEDFIHQLQRAELIDLTHLIPAKNKRIYEIRWWRYPFRIIPVSHH